MVSSGPSWIVHASGLLSVLYVSLALWVYNKEIFEHIWGIFKEYLENMFNVFDA